jgi:crossover junction endodeoxyribonuclease RuvC
LIIFGVDPGSIRTGYGAIETDGRRHRLLEMGVLKPPARLPLPERLRILHAGLQGLITRVCPRVIAVEDLFHAVNARSALVLGHVRGVVLLAGAQAGLEVLAFSPATVKAQITGYGRAEKRQVALMVSRLLELPHDEAPGDATDALAVALCGAHLATAPARRLGSAALPVQAGSAKRRSVSPGRAR